MNFEMIDDIGDARVFWKYNPLRFWIKSEIENPVMS